MTSRVAVLVLTPRVLRTVVRAVHAGTQDAEKGDRHSVARRSTQGSGF